MLLHGSSSLSIAGLVLGGSLDEMLDNHLATFLPPMASHALHDLFVAGAIGPPPGAGVGTRRAEMGAVKRSNLKRKEVGEFMLSPVFILAFAVGRKRICVVHHVPHKG